MRDKKVSRYCNYCAKDGRASVYIDQDGSPMWRLVCEQCRAETTGLLKEGECVETPYDEKAAIDKIKMKDNAVIVFPYPRRGHNDQGGSADDNQMPQSDVKTGRARQRRRDQCGRAPRQTEDLCRA